jgi:tetratricopeptide (TPR) repeat protein
MSHVRIRRELAAARPDAFRPALAMSLNNQSGALVELGRGEDALAAITEAVAIYRELAAARPDAFRPDLAGSLTSLGITLTKLGDFDAALSADREAATIYSGSTWTPDWISPRKAPRGGTRSLCCSEGLATLGA